MQVTPFVLGAGQSARIALGGNYFRLLVTTAVVTVRLYRQGRPFSEAVGVLAGYWAKPDQGFEEVEIFSASAQTVYIGTIFGVGGYDRAAGDVNITNSMSLQGVMSAAAQPALTREVGYIAGSNSASVTAINAASTAQVWAAGSNVNGAIVWSCAGLTGAAAANQLNLLAKATAPVSAVDGLLFYQLLSAAGGVGVGPLLAHPRFIAAGLGLYWYSSQTETSASRFVDYTLL